MRSRTLTALLAAALLIVAAACGSDDNTDTASSGSGLSGNLSLVAYSTPQAAYTEIEKAFQAGDGKDVKFTESYGASGDQSRAVESGQEADVVAFSLEPDISRLVKAGIVAEDWNADQYKGLVTKSVVAFVVRKGNPKNIKTWDDLVKDGVDVINPDPFQSGGARWNVMAAYGAQIQQGKSETEAVDYLKQLYKHISVQDESARKALGTFTGGKGDVLLAYENEAIFAQQNGEDIDYVIPDQTILIENPVAITKNAKNAEAAKAFLTFIRSTEAQTIFAKNGYRPVIEGIKEAEDFPTPPALFDITKFGGWDDVMAKFFDPEGSVMKTVEESINHSVS